MKITYLSRKKLSSLKDVFLNKNIIATEAKSFLMSDGTLLKRFYNDEGEYFSEKIYTVSRLSDAREKINDKRFVLPLKLVSAGGKVIGYSMPFIVGENLDNILNNSRLSTETKFKYLKEAGSIIDKMDSIRKIEGLEDLYLGDIHSQNFMVDTEGVKIIDLDSVRIGNLDGFPIKNSYPVKNFRLFSKYEFKDDQMLASRESDIAMYNLMVMNFMAGKEMHKMGLDKFYEYINFLNKQGMDKEVVDEFRKIYSNEPGKTVTDKLDNIEQPIGKYHVNVFKLRSR